MNHSDSLKARHLHRHGGGITSLELDDGEVYEGPLESFETTETGTWLFFETKSYYIPTSQGFSLEVLKEEAESPEKCPG